MKSKILIRKDLKISFNRLASIISQAGGIINEFKKDVKGIEILEVMNTAELHSLEAVLIENGLFFEWLEDKKTLVGMVVPQDSSIFDSHDDIMPYKKYEPDVLADNVNETLEAYKEKVILLSKDIV